MSEPRFDERTAVTEDSEGMLPEVPPPPRKKRRMRLAAEYVVKVAVMAALLTALKFALSFIPNVEVVTLLITVYAAVFGAAYVFPAVLVFCAVEVAIYGVGSWVILYFVYWPLLAALSCLILSRKRSAIVAAVTAAVMSAFFGVLSACCDTLYVAVGFPRSRPRGLLGGVLRARSHLRPCPHSFQPCGGGRALQAPRCGR